MTKTLFHERFPSGTTIFREGERGDVAYIIERGKIEISGLRGDSRVQIAVLGEGEIFGEMALIDDQPRSATASAMEDTVVLAIHRKRISMGFESIDPLLKLFFRVVLDRLRRSTFRIGVADKRRALGMPAPLEQPHDTAMAHARDHALQVLSFEEELEQAIENQEFELYHQAIVALDGYHVSGFEGLIRWRHPTRGMLLPEHFIHRVEESDLILPVGSVTFSEGFKALKAFHGEQARFTGPGWVPVTMGVNVSPRQLRDPTFVEDFAAASDEAGVDPQAVKMEITESVLIEDPENALSTLVRVKDLGVKIVLDDFGTGYSSLGYLRRFPIDVLKIDKSFVGTMLEDKESMAIVHAIVGLAHSLDLEVVAEGVERHGELDRLKEMGCDYAQGFLFSQPIPLTEAMAVAGRPLDPRGEASGELLSS